MSVDKVYILIESFDDREVFFSGLLRSGHRNKNYKLHVFKSMDIAQKRLDSLQLDYQRYIDDDTTYYQYRLIGDLNIVEYKR